MPKVSVIMSVYTEPVEWVQLAIDSVLNQSFSDFEFIIINDKPDNIGTIAILNSFALKDNRVVVHTNEDNIGLTKSLNIGIHLSKGEYIARMDADDFALPDRFTKQVSFLDQNKDVDVCGTCIELFGAQTGNVYYPENHDDMYLFLSSPFAHPTVMMRKECISKTMYDESYPVSQDYALWVTLYSKGAKFYNIQEILLRYRVSARQISSSSKHNTMQKELSIILHHKAFQYYCDRYNLPNPITEESISYAQIQYIAKYVRMPKDVKRKFIFYLYCSVQESWFSKLYNIIVSGNFMNLSMSNILRITKYALCGIDFKMF